MSLSLGPLGLGLTSSWVGAGGGPTYSPEALALFARFTTPPTDARKALIDALVVSLKTAGVWAKLDALYIMAAATSQAARQNWVADQYNLTAVSSPTFTADRGYTSDGSSSYLNTGFNAATATTPKFTQNSAHISVSDRTNRAGATTTQMGVFAASAFTAEFVVFDTGSVAVYRVTGGAASGYANAGSVGRYMASRVNSGTSNGYKNGSLLGSNASDTSTAPTNANFLICASNFNAVPSFFTTDQLSQASIGAGLSGTEAAAFDAAISTYLTAVGA